MRRATAGVLALGVLTLSACIDLPDSGPVVDVEVAGEGSEDRVSSIDARPPQPGASRLEIVRGFLDAMMAWPISTNVAKQFLTEDAAGEWTPDRTVIYSDLASEREDGSSVSIRMRDATHLDESGGWRGPVPPAASTLQFQLTIEDGEFRILDPLDALVVRTDWFQERYRQASLYYFDPTGQVLVPEPVFVPVGKTYATDLVTALLAGPPTRLGGVLETFIPPRLSVGLSVPVIDGVATLDLGGDAPSPSATEAGLMLAQLAATLRQEPAIRAIRLSIGGDPVDPPGAATQYDVTSAAAFDAAEIGSAGVLYGYHRGRIVAGTLGDFRPVDGPYGRTRHPLSSFAVAPFGDRVAVVSEDGRQVVVAPLRAPDDDTGTETVVAEGTAYARPAWDAAGRLWLLDRTPDGARLLVADAQGGAEEVEVADVTGTAARQILVSRDGTRLIALVGGPDGDSLVAARIALDTFGRVDRVVGATAIRPISDATVLDVAWTREAEVAVLTPARPGELFEVETVAADGATVGVDTLSQMVAGPVVGLAGEPYADTPVYAVAGGVLVDIRTGVDLALDARIALVDYAG